MKKVSLLFCAVFASVTLFAGAVVSEKQVANVSANISRDMAPRQQIAAEHNAASITSKSLRKAVAALETDTLNALYFVDNQFVSGTPSAGLFYDYGPMIVVPFADSVTFFNAYNVPGSAIWTIDGEEYARDTNDIQIPGGEFNAYLPLPVLEYDPDTVQVSESAQYRFLPYQFGTLYDAGAGENTVLMGCDGIYMTQCGRYSNYPHPAFGADNGWGWIWVGGYTGEYSYGTKVTNHLYDKVDTIKVSPYTGADTLYTQTIPSTVLFDSIVTVVYNTDVMYIWDIDLGIWCQNDEYFPDSANDVITMTILPLTDTGIDWEHPIATATAGKADYVANTVADWLGLIVFKFYEEDPIAHTKKQVPVIVDGDFVVLYSGLSKGTTDVGFLTDFDTRFPDNPDASYRTFFVDYSKGTRRLINYWNGASNILVSFGAIWPNIQGLPEEITVPLAGGEYTVTFPTNVEAEDWEIDSDEWIAIDAESITFEQGGKVYFDAAVTVTVTIDPSDVERDGLIEIDALGKIFEVVVRQTNDAPSAIDQTIKAVNDGKLYNVLGIEVDEDYKGVVIRNGEKFLQR